MIADLLALTKRREREDMGRAPTCTRCRLLERDTVKWIFHLQSLFLNPLHDIFELELEFWEVDFL